MTSGSLRITEYFVICLPWRQTIIASGSLAFPVHRPPHPSKEYFIMRLPVGCSRIGMYPTATRWCDICRQSQAPLRYCLITVTISLFMAFPLLQRRHTIRVPDIQPGGLCICVGTITMSDSHKSTWPECVRQTERARLFRTQAWPD